MVLHVGARNTPRQAYFSCSSLEGKGRVSKGEQGGEHVEHTCLGMFYVFKGKSRVGEVANT